MREAGRVFMEPRGPGREFANKRPAHGNKHMAHYTRVLRPRGTPSCAVRAHGARIRLACSLSMLPSVLPLYPTAVLFLFSFLI